MNIAYYSHYIGPSFAKNCGKVYKPVSGTLKAQGMARAMLHAGHQVTIFSPGMNDGHKVIKAHEEIIHFPEGDLKVVYPTVYSYPRCTPINDLSLLIFLRRYLKTHKFDIFVYYNIIDNSYLGSYIYLHLFKQSFRILEYEDSIFMKSLEGERTRRVWLKEIIFNYLIKRTDGLFAVCKGMFDELPIKYKILTPGVINDEVVGNIIEGKDHHLKPNCPVRVFLSGGGEYYKGTDVLVKAFQYVQHPCCLEFFTNKDYFYSVASNEIKKIKPIHKIVIHDYIPHAELIKTLVSDADILANTTLSFGLAPQSAGFPSKMMEYAAIGRPIVSSEIGMLNEEFNQFVTYYEGSDPKSLAHCIDDIIENYDKKMDNALQLQKMALSKYNISGTSKKINQLFNHIKGDGLL